MLSVVIPVKRPGLVKQRLSHVLTGQQRWALTVSMLRDVIRALENCPLVSEIVLLTAADPPVNAVNRIPVTVYCDGQTECGLNRALSSYMLGRSGELKETVLVLHSDLPALRSLEIEELYRFHSLSDSNAITLVGDKTGYGTNALLFSPGALTEFQFGHQSRMSHRKLIEAVGAECREFQRPGLALDIDTETDLLAFVDLCEYGNVSAFRTRETYNTIASFDVQVASMQNTLAGACHG